MFILPRNSDEINHPSITIGIKIEREMDYVTLFDEWSFGDFMYTLKHRVNTPWAVARIYPRYNDDYSVVNYYVELRGGSYGSRILEMNEDPLVDNHTPGHQRCVYDSYFGYSMYYKDERYSIPKPYNLSEEDQTHWEESEPTQQFNRDIKFQFTGDCGYDHVKPFVLEKWSIIPKAKQLSMLRARLNRHKRLGDNELHILRVFDNDGTIIVRVSNEKPDEEEAGMGNTPGYQKCVWDYYMGMYAEYNYFHGEWHEHKYPLPEDAVKAIEEANPQSDDELLAIICKYL